jgi:hypothetical protein
MMDFKFEAQKKLRQLRHEEDYYNFMLTISSNSKYYQMRVKEGK